MRAGIFHATIGGLLVAALAVPAYPDVIGPGELKAIAQQEPKKPQEPQAEYTIAVEVPLVRVDAVVTDSNGNFITGLKKENFRVLEDGVPQTTSNFAPVEAPITIVLLVEFRKSLWDYFAYQSTDWAYGFLNHLNKDDWVALVTFDMRTHIEMDFTRNKMEVQNILARMYFPGFSEANLFDAVIETVDRLKEVKGKKAILILASGYDTFSKHSLDDVLKTLRQSDVTIFSIGVGRDFYEYFEARGRYSGAGRIGYLQAENQLNSFARMTGGKAWFPRFQGELPNIFREVATMLRNQYSLGYTPSNKKRDGKFRKIKVELVGSDGAPLVIQDQKGKKVKFVVYAREGYLAPKGEVSD
jgi:VWFA-related protein